MLCAKFIKAIKASSRRSLFKTDKSSEGVEDDEEDANSGDRSVPVQSE